MNARAVSEGSHGSRSRESLGRRNRGENSYFRKYIRGLVSHPEFYELEGPLLAPPSPPPPVRKGSAQNCESPATDMGVRFQAVIAEVVSDYTFAKEKENSRCQRSEETLKSSRGTPDRAAAEALAAATQASKHKRETRKSKFCAEVPDASKNLAAYVLRKLRARLRLAQTPSSTFVERRSVFLLPARCG